MIMKNSELSSTILLDKRGEKYYNNNVRAVAQGFLLPKFHYFARLADSPPCWLFSQTINALRVADRAFWFERKLIRKEVKNKNESI